MVSKVETTKNRAPLVFVILLVMQLLSMSWNARSHDGSKNLLRSWILTAAYPVQVAFGAVGSFFYGGWHGYIDLHNAGQERDRLRVENDQMRQALSRLREEVATNHRAAEMMRVQQVLPYKSVAAHVIARSGSQFFNQ